MSVGPEVGTGLQEEKGVIGGLTRGDERNQDVTARGDL